MADKSRSDLLREIQKLSERLREQDLQLARLKKLSGESRPLRENPVPARRTRPGAVVGSDFLEGFADTIVPQLPTPIAFVQLDRMGRVLATLGQSASLGGGLPRQLAGTDFDEWIAPEDRIRWREHLARPDRVSLRSYPSFRVKPEFGVDVFATPFLMAGAAETLVVLDDRAERAATEPAAMAQDAVKRWAGLFAHELNQPLTAVLTTAQACRNMLMSGTFLPDEMARSMESLIRRVHHAADVVRQLRTMAGGEPPRRRPADLRDVVRRALDVLQNPIDVSQAKVALEFAPDLPLVRIEAVQIAQVVVNLVRNALEAMSSLPASRRQLTVRAQFDSREATVAVEDQGVGLSVDVIQRLFQPLASAKPTGMGLGLSFCRQVIEAHGGRVWAKGNSVRGCTFSFAVPITSEES